MALLALALVALSLALMAVSAVAVVLVRERRETRAMVDAPADQPTNVALRRTLRRRVDRDELSSALFSREALLEASPLPVLVIDDDGRIGRVNSAARVELGGVDVGSAVADLSPELARAVAGVLGGPPVAEAEIVAGADRRVWLAHLRSHPSGGSRAAVAVLVDVTETVDFRESRRLFSAAVSHELRTPLQRIVGLVDTLALPLSDEERTSVVRQAEDEVERMRQLIDEMLLLAALDRGEAALTASEADAAEVVRGVVAARAGRARERGMHLEASVSPGLNVQVPERLLEVVLGNVVDNAINYAGDGASVEVVARGLAGEVEFVVSDTGVGIPSEHLPHVFERFYRGEASRSSPGSGLGLAVVKHIVEAHGGRVRADSRPGEGTTVILALPEAQVVSGS